MYGKPALTCFKKSGVPVWLWNHHIFKTYTFDLIPHRPDTGSPPPLCLAKEMVIAYFKITGKCIVEEQSVLI
jgi:hypothetical protein